MSKLDNKSNDSPIKTNKKNHSNIIKHSEKILVGNSSKNIKLKS